MDDSEFFEQTLAMARRKLKSQEAVEVYLSYLHEHAEYFPHTDERVLHKPATCIVCDAYPEVQAFRRALNLPFTNDLHPNDPLLPWQDRTRASAEAWGGNQEVP